MLLYHAAYFEIFQLFYTNNNIPTMPSGKSSSWAYSHGTNNIDDDLALPFLELNHELRYHSY